MALRAYFQLVVFCVNGLIHAPQAAFVRLPGETMAPNHRMKRKALNIHDNITWPYRWDPDFPIEYGFDGSLTLREQSFVNLSLEYWQNFTCLNFEFRDDEHFQNRIVFRKTDAYCESKIGKTPLHEAQFIELADYCFRRFGGTVHEIGHVLGLCHEHVIMTMNCWKLIQYLCDDLSRPDRDDHVEILFANMKEEGHSSFEIRGDPGFSTLGLPYDFGSIMHYGSHGFGAQPFIFPPKQTIRARKQAYQLTMGAYQQISFYDMKAVNMLYCSNRCPNSSVPCQRGGQINTRTCDSCWCPDGFTGKHCEEIMPHQGKPCGGRIILQNGQSTSISTPGWPYLLPFLSLAKGQECYWLVTVPEGSLVKMWIEGSSPIQHAIKFLVTSEYLFDIGRGYSYCLDYLEVKNSSDFGNTGMRFCGDIPPAGPIYSETNEMMIIFRNHRFNSRGFKAHFYPVKVEDKRNEELMVHDFFTLWSTYDY